MIPKKQLELAIQQIIEELQSQGINTNVPLIQRRIAIFRQNFLKILEQKKREKIIGKTIQIQDIVTKETNKLYQEISKIKPETRIIKEIIVEKPQIVERIIENTITDNTEIDKLKIRFQELEKPIFHSQLSGVLPDQHHNEYHTLESHTDSELMIQLYRLVSGEIVDDLHKHLFRRIEQQVVGYAGISKNDFLTFIDDDPENLSLQCDGSTTVFTTTNNIGAVIWLTINGQMAIQGLDFNKTGNNQITWLNSHIPLLGEEIYIKYVKS